MMIMTAFSAMIFGASLAEKNYPQALYWFAGMLITLSVLWMNNSNFFKEIIELFKTIANMKGFGE